MTTRPTRAPERLYRLSRPPLYRLVWQSALIGCTLVAMPILGAQSTLAQESFTLEQVMSSPFPSDLVSAPDAGIIAWVQNAEGVRNIWVAEQPDFLGRQLTGFTEDDGQTVSDLGLTTDGRRVVFVYGDGPNRQGDVPNPRSNPEGREQAIWVVDVGGPAAGMPRRLGTGSSPVISPSGDRIAFLARGQVWTVDLEPATAGRAEPDQVGEDQPAADAKPEQLFEIRGSASSPRWSPDGSRLAFVSNRGDHSFVGVFHLETETLRYLDPSLDRDVAPTWSPNGSQLAFGRIPTERQQLPFAPRRAGLPWSLRAVDVASGEAREVWKAAEGPGSVFRGIESDTPLWWAEGNRLVFPWERDGWTHMYSVPAGGGDALLLTPGEFEVEHVSLSPEGTHVVYSSNQDDIDRRHLWRVPVTPAHAAILLGPGERRAVAPGSLPPDFPIEDLVEPRQVVFPAADGMLIHGQLFLPNDLGPGERRPAAVFFHGGSRRQMLLGWHYRGYYHNAYALNQYLASRGYVVLSVNYRSGTGYGMEFREAIDYGARGASEFNDVLGAGLYLRSRPDVDPERIGLWGGSYGGYLTALGLARASDLFAAGVDLHGVHDWNVVIRNFVPSYDPEAHAEAARVAFQASPMAYIDSWRSPVLLIHGDDDRNVPFSESVSLLESLRKQGVEVEQLVFPDEVHGFLLHENWLAAYRAAADFFQRQLEGGGS
jgi:dipeptidyl aminopeptidase/acylaminoacyl peptidase